MPARDDSRAEWRRSPHSTNGGECVEVKVWRKSPHSSNGGDCVEVAVTEPHAECAPHKVNEAELYLLRDSKDPDGPRLHFTPQEWDAFLRGVKDGYFDDGLLG